MFSEQILNHLNSRQEQQEKNSDGITNDFEMAVP